MGECTSNCKTNQQLDEIKKNRMASSARIEYVDDKFILPNEIPFNQQSTFLKVEEASRKYCLNNNISPMYVPLLSRIIAYRHEFLFQQIYTRLPQSQKQTFLEDLNSVQHDLMDSFYHHFIKNSQNRHVDRFLQIKMQTPNMVKSNELGQTDKKYMGDLGLTLIKERRVGLVLMCAGSSSRCNNNDKFLLPLPLSKETTLLDIVFDRLKKNSENYLDFPIIISCNEYNLLKIQDYVKKQKYYGFSPTNFRYIETYSLAVFDTKGKYCLNQKMRLIKRPAGTAASAEELLRMNVFTFLKDQGIRYVQFCGMENVLENPLDPMMIGLIANSKKRVCAKCVSPYFFCQELPRYFLNSETQQVQLLNTEEIKIIKNSTDIGNLPIAMNSIVFELDYLKEIVFDYNNSLFLAEKYHVINKKQTVYNVLNHCIEQTDCYSFQKDIRDIISCVKDPLLFKVSRSKEYAPIHSINKQYALYEAMNHFKERLQDQITSKDSRLKYYI